MRVLVSFVLGASLIIIAIELYERNRRYGDLALFLALIGAIIILLLFVYVILTSSAKQRAVNQPVNQPTPKRKLKPVSFEDFKNLGERAKSYIVGQDKALEKIEKVLTTGAKLSQMGDTKRRHILASFLLVGTTGTGKTETTKVIAYLLQQKGYNYLRLDMNQFSNRWSINSLLGAAKGYIGSDTPGILPASIMRNPRLVILFDEIEKAERELFLPLLQLIDEGYVQDMTTGRHLYLDHAIVFFTSNLYSTQIGEMSKTLDELSFDIQVRNLLLDYLPPEFLGRLDAIIPYGPLSDRDLLIITQAHLMHLGLPEDRVLIHSQLMLARYKELAKQFGIRYYLKKVQEDVLGS